MALIGINPSRSQEPKRSRLETIALGLDIASKTLGMAFAVPEYLQKREAAKQQKEISDKELKIKSAQIPREQAKTLADIGEKFRPVESGETADIVLPGEYGGPVKLRTKQDEKLNPYEQKIFDTYAADYQIVPKPTADSITVTLNKNEVYFKPKTKDKEDKTATNEADRRKEFLKQSEKFQSRANSLNEMMANQSAARGDSKKGIEPDAPAQLALLYQFNKLLDPTSTVREAELMNAEKTKGLPDQVQFFLTKLQTGGKLDENQVDRIIAASRRIYDAARQEHAQTESFYRKLAAHEKLNADFVVPDITIDSMLKALPEVETRTVGGKVYRRVP